MNDVPGIDNELPKFSLLLYLQILTYHSMERVWGRSVMQTILKCRNQTICPTRRGWGLNLVVHNLTLPY